MEIFFLLNLAAVSLIAVAWIARRGKRTAAVSYTHLDVYKRQAGE